MAERPKVNLTLTTTDKSISILAWIALAATLVLPLAMLRTMPDIIPSHFDGQGNVDGYSTKNTILILPAVAAFVFFLLHMTGRHPDKLNYPVAITEQNAEKQYRLATRVLRTMKLSVCLLFLFIETEVIFPWVREHVGLWAPGLGIFLIAAPVSYQIFSSMRNK